MKIGVYCWALMFPLALSAQDFRASLLQYQYNALQLNPAYSARNSSPTFDLVYFGNFASSSLLSQTTLVSVQAPTQHGGLGAVIQYHNTNSYGEFNLRPAYAYQVDLGEVGKMAFGLGLGINYADIRGFSFFGNAQNDFMAIDGSAGVYFHRKNFFAGASVQNAFDWKILSLGDDKNGGIVRESPISFHAGGVFHLFDEIQMRPMALYRHVGFYIMPERILAEEDVAKYTSADLLASFIIDGNYVVGALVGHSQVDKLGAVGKFGLSASFLMNGFRFGYAFQRSSRRDLGVALPAGHMLTLGYDFWQEEDTPQRYF
jgi:type IX secretion system PorP/SprF family membrane protein